MNTDSAQEKRSFLGGLCYIVHLKDTYRLHPTYKSHLQGRVFHVSVLFLCNLCTSSCFTAGDGHEMSHVDVINVHGRTLNSVISFIYPDVHSFYTFHMFLFCRSVTASHHFLPPPHL